ncbi:MAG: triphosphoribosyl-dephospho-CoA synthase [Planctomycetota bacterium]
MDNLFSRTWNIGAAAEFACQLEVQAPKAGNVHPGAEFIDMNHQHFVESARAIRPVFDLEKFESVGQLVLESVRATQARVGRNTNLGTLLLFAPIALAAQSLPDAMRTENASGAAANESCRKLELATNVKNVLQNLTPLDSRNVYEAIRLANPGGIGSQQTNDVQSLPPDDLVEAMRQVAHFDAVARQFAEGFADLFERYLPWLEQAWESLERLELTERITESVCWLQLQILAHEPDGLIVRKLGDATAREVQERAASAFAQAATCQALSTQPCYAELDQFLRADRHRRNPGTTADLIAATLFTRLICG